MGKRLSRPIAAYLRYIEGIKRDRQLGSGLRGRSLNLKKQVQKVVLAQRVSGNLNPGFTGYFIIKLKKDKTRKMDENFQN